MVGKAGDCVLRHGEAFLAMLVVSLTAWAPPAASGEVHWRSGPTEVARLDGAELAAAFTNLAGRSDARHVVVQFDRPIGPIQRTQLQEAGLNLRSYLGNQAFFAELSKGEVDVPALQAMPFLEGVQAIQRAWKLDPRVLHRSVPSWAIVKEGPDGITVAVYVMFHPDVPLGTEGVTAVARHEGQVSSVLESIGTFVVHLPLANLEALADEDAVQWIEWPLPKMSEINDSNRVITEADVVHAPPYGLDGTGVKVLVYDGGYARETHVDYEGRLTVRDSSGLSDHATHVCCTVGGGGVANSTYRGMAPGVTIESYGFEQEGGLQPGFLYSDPGDLEADYNEAINTYGVHISNNSIGSNVESNGYDCTWQGDYGVTAALIDAIVGGSLGAPFRIVWAAGNERQGSRCDVEGYGDYYSVAPPGGAKNHITVGALNSNDDSMTWFSTWGPTDDGRMKPDVSGPGCQSDGDGTVTSCSSASDTSYTGKCGTSMASPTVCGVSALLLQDFRAQFPDKPDPRNSTLKILLAHNATDRGNTGPDYQFGYGSVRIQQSIDFMRTENFLEDQVDQSGTFSVLVSVNPGDPELRVTLAWDDVPGTPNVDPALVNDLDLRVFDPSAQQHYPWTLNQYDPGAAAVQTQADHTNNIEQVYVQNPAVGIWQVDVYGYDVSQGPQTFSLAASPLLIACSSQGTISLDSTLYACSATAAIQVIDCDLNTNDTVVETVDVTIDSTTEPAGESVTLTETGPETAKFQGSIPLDAINSVGVLQVAHGDTITATYIDADDGQGGTNVPVTATATADCTGPVISNVQVTDIGSANATVTFNTDEPATGTVRYGLSCGALSETVSETSAGTAHSLVLTGLVEGTTYFFAVDAVDERGNPSTDDNGGSCYSFSTLDVVYSFLMDTDPGWTTEGLWAWGQPTGGGGQYGEPDPTSGYTGSNVYGYNLNGDYENYLAETHLTSTAIDCTGLSDVGLKFWRWLGVEQPLYDHAYVRVSNNGSTWTTIWENPTEITDSSWTMQEFDISAIADNQPTVYLRWTMGTTDVGWQYCGWNIDDVQIMAFGGVEPTCDDGILNQGEDRIDCGGPCLPCDCLSDGECADALFCNGAETCDAWGHCQPGSDPCPGQYCDEDTDSCVECLEDSHCEDGLFCNGADTCSGGTCVHAGDPCVGGPECADTCDEAGDTCNVPAGTPCTDDGNPCTDNECNGTGTCVAINNTDPCDDGLFCNGADTCSGGSCVHAGDPCTGGPECADTCDETGDTCNVPAGTPCTDDGNVCTDNECDGAGTCAAINNTDPCDDGLFCTLTDTCSGGVCVGTGDPCPGQICDEDNDQCIPVVCNNNGTCDSGEDCNNCPNDCFRGSSASCGNGVCESANGEDCVSCPGDCNSYLEGKPNGRYCCGDGTAQYGVTCSDSRCTGGGNTCTSELAVPSCCGDGTCEGSEDSFNCEVDCGPPPVCGDDICNGGENQCNCPADCGTPPVTETNCTDGIDNDCDDLIDGADPDCACLLKGEPCTVDSECCSNWCHRGACK